MDSKERFSNKVANYVKYRPSYPPEYIGYLLDGVGLSGAAVADVGAGTGILTGLLAPGVGKIYAVEPNFNMRSACVEHCGKFGNFTAVDGSAEQTGLADGSVDFVTVAQAFHWFDRPRARLEFRRILRENGRVALVWNSRTAEDEFIRANDELCRRVCPDFNGFSGGNGTAPGLYADFFRDGACEYRTFGNDRLLTLEEYIGGSLSASYAPSENDGNYGEFIDGLKGLFGKYGSGGRLRMPTVTHNYIGRV